MPPGHPCRFPFPFSFFFLFLFSFFLPFLSFSVFPFLVPFSFVLSFRLVVFRLFRVSPSSLSFRFPAFLGDGLCYSVISSRRYPPPALLASLKYAYPPLRAVFFLAFLMLTYFKFSSLPSLFRFRFGHRLFHPVFFVWVLCCFLGFGFCCDSFSI